MRTNLLLIDVLIISARYITVYRRLYYNRGGGTGPADPAAAGPIIYGEITTKDDLATNELLD